MFWNEIQWKTLLLLLLLLLLENQAKRQKALICLFTLQIPAMTGAKAGSQEFYPDLVCL